MIKDFLFALILPILLVIFIFLDMINPKFIYKDGKAYKKNIFGIECISCCKEGKLNAE